MKLFTLNDSGITPGIEIVVGEREYISGVPVTEEVITSVRSHLQRLLQQAPAGDRTILGTRFLIDNLDLTMQDGAYALAPSKNVHDQRALLLVDVMPGMNGEVLLKSGLLKESIDDKTGLIQREPAGIEESLGVLNVASQKGVFPTHLVVLQPGARIRILRTGDTQDQHGVSLPSELVINWTGWTHPQVETRMAARPPKSMNPRAYGMRVKAYP